ncbi:hypothetical protein T492DRAFT_1148517 [Pavlovales sp. CCMP2436]|nr:hypothetical protein T492DRAFT_1148517 [Pavlovales sp. CCMP2436]
MWRLGFAWLWFAWLGFSTTCSLFHDLLAFPRANGNPTCRLDKARKYREANAPWLSQTHLGGYTVPTLHELRETMLSEVFVFNSTRQHCVDDPSVMPRGLGPPDLCVQGFPKRGNSMLFDQYSLEVILLTRWLQEAPICKEEVGSCGARMVIVPSLIFHHTAAVGRSWLWNYCMTAPLAAEYWRRAAARYFTPGIAGALIVVADSYCFDTRVHFALLNALSKMPAEFRARVVILCTISNLQLGFRRIAGFGQPWQSGADAELQRRRLAALGAFDEGAAPDRAAHDHRANTAGTDSSSHIWSNVRERIARALVSANATCTPSLSRCVLSAPHAPGCAGTPKSTFGDSARSVLCIEPPGDVLGRSHAYVDVITGCIPVLVEGGHPAYPKGEPTSWPWRAAPGISANASPLRGLTLDYNAFSLLPDGGGSKDSDAAVRVVSECLAADKRRLLRMRAELARVAPLCVYARRRPPAGAPEDAFERLRKTLARVLRLHA